MLREQKVQATLCARLSQELDLSKFSFIHKLFIFHYNLALVFHKIEEVEEKPHNSTEA